jgi:gas vesicle protein
MATLTFTSPLRKLVRFFQRSRDAWKAKCQRAKETCKRLSNQVRAVEKSRQHWKEVAQQAQRTIRDLEEALSEQKNASAPAESPGHPV